MTKEELQELRAMMREEINAALEPVNKRLDKFGERLDALEETVAEIKEDTEITRGAVNALVDWADNVAVITQVRFPVKKSKAE